MKTDFIDSVGAFVPGGRFVIPGAPSGRLRGLTFAAKDLFDVAGHPTGAGNPTWLATHEAPKRSSPIIEKLLAEGATLVGKTITDELAYSLHGDNMHYGAPLNARALLRVTGGSSSGSAAAVGAQLVDFALGTDTGGSTRVPASYCGIWGLRTTHGSLSAQGLVPLHPSYDTPTWLAHDPVTFVRVAEVLSPETSYVPTRLLHFTDASALADDVFAPALASVLDLLAGMLGKARPCEAAAGAGLAHWRSIYATSGAAEGWKAHGAWIDQAKPDFAPAVASRWENARGVSAAAAEAARADAKVIRQRVRAHLGEDGIAVLPSAASLAPFRNADPAAVDAVRLRTMAITCIAGLSGLPQVSIPFAAPDGAPLGISLLGPAGSDLALARLAMDIRAQLA